MTESSLNTKRQLAKLATWQAFYKHFYSIEVTLDDLTNLQKTDFSKPIVVVPKEIGLQECFILLEQFVGKFITNITTADELTIQVRRFSESYITNIIPQPTLIETLLADIMDLHDKENIVRNRAFRNFFIDPDNEIELLVKSTNPSDYISYPSDYSSPWDKLIKENRNSNLVYSIQRAS